MCYRFTKVRFIYISYRFTKVRFIYIFYRFTKVGVISPTDLLRLGLHTTTGFSKVKDYFSCWFTKVGFIYALQVN